MKVFYISTRMGEVYYVRAKDVSDADEKLREAVSKYLFQRKLKDDHANHPDTLGDDIIVEFGINKLDEENPIEIENMTAAAMIFSENNYEQWGEWEIEEIIT